MFVLVIFLSVALWTSFINLNLDLVVKLDLMVRNQAWDWILWCEKISGLALEPADVFTLSASHPCRKQLSEGILEPVVRESPAGPGHPADGHPLMGWVETVLPLVHARAQLSSTSVCPGSWAPASSPGGKRLWLQVVLLFFWDMRRAGAFQAALCSQSRPIWPSLCQRKHGVWWMW